MKRKKLFLKRKLNSYIDVDRLIPDFRKEYLKGKKIVSRPPDDPYLFFVDWFEEALLKRVPAANAMALATFPKSKFSSVRIVLLKGLSRKGFVFFSSYKSPKAREMAFRAKAACVLFWPELEKQVRFSGRVVKLSRKESTKYFETRPRGAQLAAWVSPQSQPVESRRQLEREFFEIERKFLNRKVAIPSHWGGFRIIPDRFEFWQGRKNRLNDRFLYARSGTNRKWRIMRLKP